MDESLITIVVDAEDKNDAELEVRFVDDDVLEWRLNGKLIFAGDWSNNFLLLFKRAIELWNNETKEG